MGSFDQTNIFVTSLYSLISINFVWLFFFVELINFFICVIFIFLFIYFFIIIIIIIFIYFIFLIMEANCLGS